MEVFGKIKNPDLDKRSGDTTVYCQPCKKRIVAKGFCQTCEEYMCTPCIESHTKFRMSRNHIMSSKDEMPTFNPSTKQSDIGDTEYCKYHPREMVKFYCPTHDDLGCSDCIVLDHRNCVVDYITDVSKSFVDGREFEWLTQFRNQFENILSESILNVKEIYDKVQNQAKVEINKLRKIRANVIYYLDRREKELLDNIRKVKTEDESLLAALKTEFESTKAKLEAMRTKMTSEDVSVNQRYVAARRAKKELRETEGELEKMAGRLKARKIRFCVDKATWLLLESSTGLGRLDVSGEFRMEIPAHVPDLSTMAWKKEADIEVSTLPGENLHGDNFCSISGSALLSPGLILLAHKGNQSVKLLDVTAYSVRSCLQFQGQPWDVCVLPDDKAAVTIPEKAIVQLLSTKRRELTPNYLTVSAFTQPTLYVSDYNSNTVLQLSMDGEVLREYQNEQLKGPMSVVAVGFGQLFVCGGDSNNVMLLTERDGNMVEILGEKNGLMKPSLTLFKDPFLYSFDCMLKPVDDAVDDEVDDAVDERE
ncbi:E3 ubiquitin-protein ligase TRIM71-like [Mya arenaria]|uniref:E3 ubiquitin-protein ligase TRIM71-like n=1 Tax=Mya arenaria TaxID=6604 RepID=UPI0022DFE3C1|nr:E3 ubiquitin-protein ligase TRIM71-like [Mya arenaria]